LWFPLDYDGLIIRIDLWLAPPSLNQFDENEKLTCHLHH
jgi:hypothetical protein